MRFAGVSPRTCSDIFVISVFEMQAAEPSADVRPPMSAQCGPCDALTRRLRAHDQRPARYHFRGELRGVPHRAWRPRWHSDASVCAQR